MVELTPEAPYGRLIESVTYEDSLYITLQAKCKCRIHIVSPLYPIGPCHYCGTRPEPIPDTQTLHDEPTQSATRHTYTK